MLAHASLSLVAALVAVSPRWSYEEAYLKDGDGQWYIGADNETATLAWGESYVMMSLAAMYRATGHPMYLDRLAEHIDAVLDQRDDIRGVSDYRGVSGACWRNLHYQPNDEPYCYAVHTGMLIYPMVEFARLVMESPWAASTTYDGEVLADKAAIYLAAAEDSVAFHEFEWDDAGFYRFAADAGFLAHAGEDQPLNQSNAMGRALVVLAAITGDPGYAAKASALAARLKAQMSVGGDGAYLWNYWGGPYAGNGEDISHAAINVDFAALAAEHGIVFTAADVDRLAATFVQRVYVDDGTFRDFIGGGPTNDPSYRPQVGRWLRVSRARPAVYTAVRDLFERHYPPAMVGSASHLVGWALLAEHEPAACPHFFYSVDWQDQGEWQQATAYGANVLTTPPALDTPCVIPLEVEVSRPTTVQQWDGDAYHRVASWAASAGPIVRRVAFDPRWPFVYWMDGVLFQFADDFAPGQGIRVREHDGWIAPAITSTPPATGEIGEPLDYVAAGEGEPPIWWRLVDGPADARVDPASGAFSWAPAAAGAYAFTLRLETEAGAAEQAFVIEVGDDAATGGASTAGESTGDASTTGAGSSSSTGAETTGESEGGGESDGVTVGDGSATATSTSATGGAGEAPTDDAGCGCRSASPAGGLGLIALALLGRRRRRDRR